MLIRITVSLLMVCCLCTAGFTKEPPLPVVKVVSTDDFEITDDGSVVAWRKAPWIELKKREPNHHHYTARAKVLYSKTGLYFLMEGTDRKLTATIQKDFQDLWLEDVFEVFLWTDERFPIYFEYEISPLNRELPILIPNFDGQFLGWRPWHYEGDRKIKKRVSIIGGDQKTGADIRGWRAEFFVPYDLLKPLRNVPPKPGTKWRANFYRVDYDGGKSSAWEWSEVGPSFHDYKKFGVLKFE